MDETYRKAGKMDSECFSSKLDLSHTDLMKIIRGYLLEGTQSTNNVKTELYKLNVYSTLLFHAYLYLYYVTAQIKGHSSSLTLIRHAATGCSARLL